MSRSVSHLAGVHFEPLPAVQRPLLNKFYKLHRSPMRSTDELAWVARKEGIIAALKLSPVADGFWLTGVFSAPAERGRGVASALLDIACEHAGGPVWLFCAPPLQDFYAGNGFHPCEALPAELGERLRRYQSSRTLIAMVRRSDLAPV